MKEKKKKQNGFETALDNELSSGSTYNDEYFTLAKEQEFDQLLNKEIQLENAKENALKHTQTQLAGQGLNTTGYGSSMQAGIFNNFLNAFAGAQNQASQNINNINLEQAKQNEVNAQNRFENFAALVSTSNNLKEVDQLYEDYGYGKIGADGTFVFNEKPQDMSEDDWLQTKAIYRQTAGALDGLNNSGNVGYSVGELRSMPYLKQDGNAGKLSEDFVEETEKLFQNVDKGVYKDGDAIRVGNMDGEVIYLKYEDGGFKMITTKEYRNSTKKRELIGKGHNKFEER